MTNSLHNTELSLDDQLIATQEALLDAVTNDEDYDIINLALAQFSAVLDNYEEEYSQ